MCEEQIVYYEEYYPTEEELLEFLMEDEEIKMTEDNFPFF